MKKNVLFKDIAIEEAFVIRGYGKSFVIMVKWIDAGYAKCLYKSINVADDPALEKMEVGKYYHYAANHSVERV